jgi:GNAT superfamily N-acetyltransferase
MLTLRSAISSDVPAISDAMAQLGYPCHPDELPPRIARLADDPDVLLTIAEHHGKAVGLVTAHVIRAIHKSDPVAMLTALVVLESARGLGIGKQLVARAEDWARSRGATAISLTSALRRAEAHEFYKALGYEHTGLRLAKALT